MSKSPDAPASVVILNAEDDPACTIVPRLAAACADLDKIRIIEAVRRDDGAETLPSLRTDVEHITEAVKALQDCRLIVIDPITAYLGGTNDLNNGALRGVLSPLTKMAEGLGVALVLVTHLSKSPRSNAKHRVLGSIGYVAACRANFLFEPDSADSSGRRMLMRPAGCNLVAPPPVLGYLIEDRGGAPVLAWESEPMAATGGEPPSRIEAWLSNELADGPVAARDVFERGRAEGFSKDQLKRAKARLGAQSDRINFGRGSHSSWALCQEKAPAARSGRDVPRVLPPPARLALPAPRRTEPGREIVLWTPPKPAVDAA